VRSIAVYGGGSLPALSAGAAAAEQSIELDSTAVRCGLVHWDPLSFNGSNDDLQDRVLVRKRGFCCNFRDRGLILEVSRFAASRSCYVIGSEFVGEVVETGCQVFDLRPGDRVIGNYSYPHTESPNAKPGVPSSHTSLEFEVFHRAKLVKIPNELPDEVAAGFTIGAQTSYSMIGRLGLQGGESVLVTSGRSNTSLFLLNGLRRFDVDVYVTTSSDETIARRFDSFGVRRCFQVEKGTSSFSDDPEIRETAESLAGFDCVLDPFFDLNLVRVANVIATGGRYVTCGFFGQAPHVGLAVHDQHPEDLNLVMRASMLKNFQLIGNCSGATADLQRAVQDYADGKLEVVTDSVFAENEPGAWLLRTFCSAERFGKTPMLYARP
jgi:NADPH:quinone reductase-like Zn-dependent oxidoreductase